MTKLFTFSFLVLTILLTLFSYAFVDKNLSYLSDIYTAFSFNQRLLTSIIFVFIISLMFALYFFIARAFYENKIGWDQIKKIIFSAALILFFSYPAMVSYDIFNYTTTAKVLFGYRENPYIVMPIEFVNDEFLSYTHAANKLALYGPFWLILTTVPFLLTSSNFIVMMFGFKLLVVIFYAVTLFLIWSMTKNQLAVVFFGLNPLVLFETFVSSHNDIVMMFFALLSFYLLEKRSLIFSGISFIASFLIKFATLFLLPVYFYAYWMKLKNKKINWEKVYLVGSLLMSLIFFLSPLREEIYQWYFIWVLSFVVLTRSIKLYILSGIFSFFLLLRYVPFMYLGTHFGITPYLKIAITFGPLMFLIGVLTYLKSTNSKHK